MAPPPPPGSAIVVGQLSENAHQLMTPWYKFRNQGSVNDLFTYELIVDFNMFSASMRNRIGGKIQCAYVILE